MAEFPEPGDFARGKSAGAKLRRSLPAVEGPAIEGTDLARTPPLRAAPGRPVDDPPPIIEPSGFEPSRGSEIVLARRGPDPTQRALGSRSLGSAPLRRPERRSFLVPRTPAPARDPDALDRAAPNPAPTSTGTAMSAPPRAESVLRGSAIPIAGELDKARDHERNRARLERPLRQPGLLPGVHPTRPSRRPRPALARVPALSAAPPRQIARPVRSFRNRRKVAIVAAVVLAALLLIVGGSLASRGLSLDRFAAVWRTLHGRRPLPPAGPAPVDPGQRAAYFETRAKAGEADSQMQLAVLYAKGEGVAQDYAIAATWFRAAAQQGLARAQYDLAVLYERGRGVTADMAEAVRWYSKAAQQGYPLAQYNLAVAYTKGQGVRQDFIEAALWYHRAAAQGIIPAMVNLAILYEQGQGVDASAIDAYAWYSAAAERGSVPAQRRMEELMAGFSQWDQSRASALAANVSASIHEPAPENRAIPGQGGSGESGQASFGDNGPSAASPGTQAPALVRGLRPLSSASPGAAVGNGR